MTAAALICWPTEGSASWTFWPTPGEAAEAADAFPDCRARCQGKHSIVFNDSGRIRAVPASRTTPADQHAHHTADERQTA
jgi:hypothetical protein